MKIVEVKGQVDQQHKLHVDATLPSFEPGPVRVIILPPEGHTEADDNREWLMAAMANPAFDFLKDSAEDIYTLTDGKAFRDQG